jgi:hypothetical protein
MKLPPPRNLSDQKRIVLIDAITSVNAGYFGYLEPQENPNNKNLFLRRKDRSIVYYPCVVWTHCRDEFQDVPDCSICDNGFWYCHIKNQGHNVCAFIDRIVNKICATRHISRTKFFETDYDNILWVVPSEFWISNFIRRSFFSLSLRCGQWYKRSKFDLNKAFNHYEDGRDTDNAIKRFLNGYTFYIGDEPEFNSMGWGYLMAHLTKAEAARLLI